MIRACVFVFLFTAGTVCFGFQVEDDPITSNQDDPNSPTVQEPEKKDDATINKDETATLTVQESLLKAMDEIVPGEFDEGSELAVEMRNAAIEFSENKADKALEILDSIAKKNKDFPPPSLLMAGMYFAVRNGQQAIALLEKTALDSPDYPSTYVGFARIAIQGKRWTDANALLEKVERIVHSGSWNEDQKKQFQLELLDGKVDVAMGQKRFADARASLIELSEVRPDKVRVPLRLAEAEFELGNIDACIERLQEAKEIEPNVLWYELILFNWYTRRNDLDSAKKWIDLAAVEHPDDAMIQLSYGRHLLLASDYSEAKIWAKKAEDSGADKYSTTFLQGQIAFVERAYGMSEYYFGELSRSRPADFAVANMFALCLVESENLSKKQQALQMATNTARLNPKNLEALSTLGWIYLLAGEQKRADQLLGQVARSGNIKPDTAFYIAHLLESKGDYEGAEKLLKRCLDTKGFFLFRNRADEMRKKVAAKLSEQKSDDGESKKSSGQPKEENKGGG